MTSATGAHQRLDTIHQRQPASVIGLIGLLILLTVGALQGGIAMVVHPLEPLGMPTSFLDGLPIETYLWPGIFLLSIAAGSALTVVGLASGWRWRWAGAIERRMRFRWPWIGAMSIGSLLLVFELIELFVVPFHPVMHPLLVAGSLAIVGLTATPSTRRHLRAV